jgi:hypothetical protein
LGANNANCNRVNFSATSQATLLVNRIEAVTASGTNGSVCSPKMLAKCKLTVDFVGDVFLEFGLLSDVSGLILQERFHAQRPHQASAVVRSAFLSCAIAQNARCCD